MFERFAGEVEVVADPYGSPITLENAKKVAAATMAEVRKNGWTMAVAVVDPSGNLIYFEKMDDTQIGSGDVSIDKARSAARFKRPTRAFQDAVTAGGAGLRFFALRGAVPIEGGVPLVLDGKLVGAVGVSGGTSEQDGRCATVGASSLS